MKTLTKFLNESIQPSTWRVKYVFTPEDIEFFKKDPKFHWNSVVKIFGTEPTEVACNQKNLIVNCLGTQFARYIWFNTIDVPAKRVRAKDDSDLDVSYIKGIAASALYTNDNDGEIGACEVAIQGLKWMIERGITK